MKKTLVILISLVSALPLSAAFTKWTNKEGKIAELKLVEVTGEGEETVGIFTMRNGRSVTIRKTDLDEESGKRLEASRPAPAPKSVFDEMIEKNLVILDDNIVKAHKLAQKPKKYYIFYYTASWCGPCLRFTPELVKFYNKHKNENFELVLISSDRDEKSMEAYAKKNQMPWPQIEFSQVATFKGQYNHGVRGIPSVIVCDLEGKIVPINGRDLVALEQLVK
ncbi:MAG: thioredoxin-like domain-containing protein [Akkermansiaceae bacterium]|jgi:thiol-disulfide isomerase/thioredoxin